MLLLAFEINAFAVMKIIYQYYLPVFVSYSNRITRDGALEISKVLKENTAIEILDLGYNRLEDDGACHIAEALKTYNTNLQT